jgi:hypothetical protein
MISKNILYYTVPLILCLLLMECIYNNGVRMISEGRTMTRTKKLLQEYQSRRNFKISPEPKVKNSLKTNNKTKAIFVVPAACSFAPSL